MKTFTSNRLTKKQLRSLIYKTAKQFGVNKVLFSSNAKHVSGTYNVETGNIYLDTKQTKSEMLCTFFHELGHHDAVTKNKWSKYHHCQSKLMSVNTVFNIENKIDKIGETLWYKHVDSKQWGKYKYAYPKSQKSYIIKNFINQ